MRKIFMALLILTASTPVYAAAGTTSEPIMAHCSLNGSQAERCVLITATEDTSKAGIGVFTQNSAILLEGRIQAGAKFSVDAVSLNGDEYPSYGQCQLRAPVISCVFGPTPTIQNFSLTVIVD